MIYQPNLSALKQHKPQTNLSWSGATDNIGVTGYDVLRNGVVIDPLPQQLLCSYRFNSFYTYTFNVRAKDGWKYFCK
jgi:hypothetical protein